jgi:hypothetical protein
MELDDQGWVASRHFDDTIKNLSRQKWVIVGAHEQSAPTNSGQELQGTRARIVIGGPFEAVNGRGNGLIEIIQRPSLVQPRFIEETWMMSQLRKRLATQRGQKMPSVQSGEAAFDMTGPTLEIVGHRYGDGGLELKGDSTALLAQPFQQHIPAQRESRSNEWLSRVILNEAAHHEVQIARLPRMIEARGAGNLAIAAAEDEHIGGPAATTRLVEQPAKVVRPNCPLESV